MWRSALAPTTGRSHPTGQIRRLQLISIRDADDDLANILPIVQKAVRVLVLLKGKDPADRGRDDALPHQLQQFLDVLLHQHRVVGAEPAHVDAVEALIAVEHRQVDRAGRLQRRHCDLDVSPSRRQTAHALLDRISRQRVDHNVNTPAAGQRRDLLFKIHLAVIDQVTHPETGKITQLRLRTSGGVDFGAVVPRQLYGNQPCAARSSLDQHPLPSPHLRLAKRIDHCERDRRKRAGLRER